ncbi:olfactory receptor 11A1-like [Salarias fasciatus]|uniref:olfactory receptor 11A1-like n=1 Tax=Salarias fasciatus TaxID=181472 RepID=UPI001176A2A1|nr:olfactory receptor 11A1-like [Salarias fasciatus]
MNSTRFSHFRLTAYSDTGPLRHLYFFMLLLLYVFIMFSNLLLILVICVNRTLHEPMYLFLVSLFVNELYGSSGLFPLLLVQVLSDSHIVSAPLCLLQIFVIYSYGGVEYFNLAVMSYDRYLAICCPLHYNTGMTCRKIAVLIAVTWLYPLLACVVIVYLSSSLTLCGNDIPKVYCDNYYVVKLACSNITAINIFELFAIFFTICAPLCGILFTYLKIIRVCFSGSKETRQKAVRTCTPQLASLINFTFGSSFQTVQSRFNMKSVSSALQIFLSLYTLTCQPLFNPSMYGLNLSKIRHVCKKLLFP